MLVLINVGLLPVKYRVEQLKMGHMYNVINRDAPFHYLRTNIEPTFIQCKSK